VRCCLHPDSLCNRALHNLFVLSVDSGKRCNYTAAYRYSCHFLQAPKIYANLNGAFVEGKITFVFKVKANHKILGDLCKRKVNTKLEYRT
jgi:hypothetical protein